MIRKKSDEERVTKKKSTEEKVVSSKGSNFLEVDDSKKINLANIVSDNTQKLKSLSLKMFEKKSVSERENSSDFVDDSSVPPLE